jgi:Zn-finger nucleic acid-binding protein
MENTCPLCNSFSTVLITYRNIEYSSCPTCSGIFMDRTSLPSKNDEVLRYTQHNNDVHDVRYQKFVQPIVAGILQDFDQSHLGLDFGAGTGPVISKLLMDEGYVIQQYDPFFHNHAELLDQKYDYIACCEVVEHFHNPATEFKLLSKLLKNKGKLYIKTALFAHDTDFGKWHYKDDPTHVFFFQENTMEYIRDKFGFSQVVFINDVVIFSKGG